MTELQAILTGFFIIGPAILGWITFFNLIIHKLS
jgi:hypothetical protein